MKTWRERAVEAVDAVMRQLPRGATPKQVEAYIRAEYPFGERQYWPYKVWLKVVRERLWREFPSVYDRPWWVKDKVPGSRSGEAIEPLEGQKEMFADEQ